MSYTVGSWTFAVDRVDSISTPKSLSIPDLSWADDYSASKDNGKEVVLINTTGEGVIPSEVVRFNRTRVRNIYDLFEDLGAPKLANEEGVRIYSEVRYVIQGTNSVSGESVAIPMRGWVSLVIPTSNLVSSDMITDLAKRTVSTMFGTGEVSGAQLLNEARGDINPTM